MTWSSNLVTKGTKSEVILKSGECPLGLDSLGKEKLSRMLGDDCFFDLVAMGKINQ